MMNKVTETFVNLGLLRAEYVTAERETAELGAFNQVDDAQKLEIIAGAEQIIMNGVNSVHRAPENHRADYANPAFASIAQRAFERPSNAQRAA